MTDAPLTVAISAEAPLAGRARWALGVLLRTADVAWREVAPGSRAAVGYGTAGRRLTLPHDAGAWAPSPSPPAAAHDPAAQAFWWLARVEEGAELAGPGDHDAHGRFAFAASALAALPGHLPAPVDDAAATLRDALGLRRRRWPGDAPFALALTHDIDTPWRYTVAGLRAIALRGAAAARHRRGVDARSAAAALAAAPVHLARRSDPWSNADAIAGLERAHGASSTSYLLAGGEAPEDGDVVARRRGTPRYARAALACGGHVGLHGSYRASIEPRRVADERAAAAAAAGVPVDAIVDHRYHYLRHAPRTAWRDLAAAGFTSDASLGYAERPALRAGTSWPYPAWDAVAERPLPLVVVPLALMDATLEPRYLDVDPARPRRRSSSTRSSTGSPSSAAARACCGTTTSSARPAPRRSPRSTSACCAGRASAVPGSPTPARSRATPSAGDAPPRRG